MSNSELSSAGAVIPPAATIEQTLKRIVREAVKNEEHITVKSARSQAEKELGLDSGFLKDDAEWKARSKSVIEAAVDAPETPAKPKAPKPAPVKAKAATKRKSEDSEEKPKKRAKKTAPDTADDGEPKPAVKRKSKPQKAEVTEDDESEQEEASKPAVKVPQKAQNGKKASAKAIIPPSDDVDDSEALSDPPDGDVKEAAVETKHTVDDDSDSAMSSLIDEPPAKSKPRKKSSDAATKPKKSAEAKKPSNTKELSPNEEEIKRLQGWLVKCGLRKLWHKELAHCDTDKAKIAHLKGMLEDVGMTGRYSVEKAKSIKEARELKEEIEAAKSFEKQWGKEGRARGKGKGGDEESEDEEEEQEVEDVQKRPGARALPKGLVDFGDSGDDGSD